MAILRPACFLILFVSATLAEDATLHRQVRRLLSEKCFRCHGPDANTRESGLRLDRSVDALAELDSGARAIVPGDSAASELMARVLSEDEDLRMPPSELGPGLSDAEVAMLDDWISAGAPYRRHWSFEPIRRPSTDGLPAGRTTIDRFLAERLQAESLTPNPRADRATLIRRATLALIGLPPTPQEVDDFVAASHPDAYGQLVQRLLASPRFGERWARSWLDIARYADSAGYAQDPARTIWRYRDWVIDAYNGSESFDTFTVDQLAGDLLPTPSNEQLLATAFHRNTMTNSEGGTDDEEFRNAAVVDRVNTTMQAWMGLTVGCAQCHDHKYDDITQREYYELYSVFNNTQDADRGDEFPWLEELDPEARRQRVALQRQIAQHQGDEDQRKALEKQLKSIRGVRTPILRELAAEKRRETFVHVRGNFRVPGERVAPGVPKSLHPIPSDPNRLDLARWLVSKDNPLTARVVVNRYWEQLFGRGLVQTSEDFGVQGELPSHLELLDFLAAELMAHDWDTNWLLAQIVESDAYCRSSRVTEQLAALDPSNQWLARGPRFRLSGEMIRDQALQVSGLLSTKMKGPSVRPPRPKLGLRAAFGGSTDWEPSRGEDRYRRGLYTSWRRTTPYPSMTTFDAPSREFCSIRRIRTNTPLQALVTLNDPVFVEAAQGLARRILREGGDDFIARLEFAFRLVIARPPSDKERRQLEALFQKVRARYSVERDAAVLMATEPRGPCDPSRVVDTATWTVISNVLLNLDETLAPR